MNNQTTCSSLHVPGLLNYYSVPITITITSYILTTYYYYYYYYLIYSNVLLPLLLLLLEMYGEPITITITSQTITIRPTITINFPLLLHLLLLPNQINTIQADYKVIFKDLYCFHGITHYHRQIITDNIIITPS